MFRNLRILIGAVVVLFTFSMSVEVGFALVIGLCSGSLIEKFGN